MIGSKDVATQGQWDDDEHQPTAVRIKVLKQNQAVF
jgi:hypothetical protein